MAARTITAMMLSATILVSPTLAPAARAQAIVASPSTAQQEAAPRLRQRDFTDVTLRSREGLEYRLLVSVPRGPPPAGGFPVFYVLDGDGWFYTAVEMTRIREWGRLTPSIVVGIGYPSRAFFDPRRNYDFTPPGSADADFAPQEQGGADRFLNFLVEVVKPWVRERHSIDPNRQVLFGHSMGGLFVLHTMFTAPQSFNVYLAASPSIRFSNGMVMREASGFEVNPEHTAVRALITVGGLESQPNPQQVDDYRRYFLANPSATGGVSVEEALRQTFPPAPPGFNKARELRRLAERLSRRGAHVVFTEFPGVEHTPAGVSALNDGVAFALRPAN
ncbi:MAG: alpha/beta hydrolase-fold protein [Vitreimonas sp.]